MTIRCTFQGSREEPAEFVYTNPIECVVCGTEWDADDHLYDEFTYHPDSEEPVCYGTCYNRHGQELTELAEAEAEEKYLAEIYALEDDDLEFHLDDAA